MRTAVLLFLFLAAPCWAKPLKKPLPYAKDPKEAVEMARSRGRLIFITIAIDDDNENRATVKNVLHDKAWQKIARDFVLIYANPQDNHGSVMVKLKDGKRVRRDADVPELTPEQVQHFAHSYVRAFYPEEAEGNYKTPIHFIIDGNEDVVDIITNGDFKSGFNHVPAATVITRMKAALRKHGKGISDRQYTRMQKDLIDAKAAKARKNVQLEIKVLLRVTALPKKLPDVKRAKGRLDEIDADAKSELAEANQLVKKFLWEDALDRLEKIQKLYAGLPTSLRAATRKKELMKDKEVKKVLLARDLLETGRRYKKNGKNDRAKKKFEECVRRGKGTKYADEAAEELKKLGAG
ncbi:MAG: hypothetical protein ACYTGZ_21040 [Planctomycetota bacterium]|jgi:hypothetical protein